MCEYCLISGAVGLLIGLGLCYLQFKTDKKKTKEEPKNDSCDLTIRVIHD